MKIVLDGQFEVAAAPERAFAFLTDPQQFGPLLPMFRELKDVQADRFDLVLDVGVPQIRGRAEAEVKFVERVANEKAAFTATVKHALGIADSTLSFTMTPAGVGTAIRWSCDSLVRGTLASLAAGLLKPLAKRNVAAMIESVQRELGAKEAA
ncbi:MAG: CoxG family protein [Betaproteobacteria bacterium]